MLTKKDKQAKKKEDAEGDDEYLDMNVFEKLMEGKHTMLGLLRIPRYTPVPWIEDNAILALPVSVLTHAVLYTFR
jgi:hypothetical protein